jgi:hypothetical protein
MSEIKKGITFVAINIVIKASVKQDISTSLSIKNWEFP